MKLMAIAMMIAAIPTIGTNSMQSRTAELPSISEVQRRAVSEARLEPSQISSWKRKAQMSALLPKLQVDYTRKVADDIDINLNDSVYVGSNGVAIGPQEGGISATSNADQSIGVRAVWSLNETLFNPDLLNVSAEARRLSIDRQSMLAEVSGAYYELERTMGEIALLKKELAGQGDRLKLERESFVQRVTCKEAIAKLDAYTGGWFGESVSSLNQGINRAEVLICGR